MCVENNAMPAAVYANVFIKNEGAILKILVVNLTLNILGSVVAI